MPFLSLSFLSLYWKPFIEYRIWFQLSFDKNGKKKRILSISFDKLQLTIGCV